MKSYINQKDNKIINNIPGKNAIQRWNPFKRRKKNKAISNTDFEMMDLKEEDITNIKKQDLVSIYESFLESQFQINQISQSGWLGFKGKLDQFLNDLLPSKANYTGKSGASYSYYEIEEFLKKSFKQDPKNSNVLESYGLISHQEKKKSFWEEDD